MDKDEKLDYIIKQNNEMIEWIKAFIEQLPQNKPLLN